MFAFLSSFFGPSKSHPASSPQPVLESGAETVASPVSTPLATDSSNTDSGSASAKDPSVSRELFELAWRRRPDFPWTQASPSKEDVLALCLSVAAFIATHPELAASPKETVRSCSLLLLDNPSRIFCLLGLATSNEALYRRAVKKAQTLSSDGLSLRYSAGRPSSHAGRLCLYLKSLVESRDHVQFADFLLEADVLAQRLGAGGLANVLTENGWKQEKPACFAKNAEK